MNKKRLLTLSTLVAVTGVMIAPQSAEAFMGFGKGEGNGDGQGMRRSFKERRGEGLIPAEMREQFREEHQNLSEEERAQMREEHRSMRDEKKAEMEEFTGVTREEMREAHQNGETMGDVLLENGKTQEDAETFLTQRANEKVDHIVERHELDETQASSLRERVDDFVQSILGRWFGN